MEDHRKGNLKTAEVYPATLTESDCSVGEKPDNPSFYDELFDSGGLPPYAVAELDAMKRSVEVDEEPNLASVIFIALGSYDNKKLFYLTGIPISRKGYEHF